MRFLLAERPLRKCKDMYSLPSLFAYCPPALHPPHMSLRAYFAGLGHHARQEECMGSAPPPPPTLGQLKQTEDVDEEADVLDRFSVYVEHSGGDWQKDDSI